MLGEPDADKPQRHLDSRYLRTEEYDKENDEVLQANYPAFFNTETKTTTVFDEYAGCVAMGVTDDGLGLIGIQGMGVNSGFIVDLASKTKVDDMLPWIRSEFGIIIPRGRYITSRPTGRRYSVPNFGMSRTVR